MARVATSAHINTDKETEYSVYIYHLPENQHEGQNDWEMRKLTHDADLAMTEALLLHQSKSYRKVEVKRRRKDPRTDIVKDKTLKVFNHEKTPLYAAGLIYIALAGLMASAALSFLFLNFF